ncbi:MAG: LysR family transcriptional regulator [Candidatus Paracaedimonas acanthamoebae]|uniref:LysR family transcriptional regulator n=1 Tax=Candidatus Paracaedimonas acanthamoebae TaxID=244581 RepID=A0A8J7PVR4_9PROT|nr:LysR family transcriptional regulator [Candidatus Paracaedimonas acanthamoebae]
MDSNRLRYFLVVAEIENIRKAADALRITPSALSKALKQLEYEIGTTLLVPTGRGISITESGRELVRRARPLMEDWEKLRHELREKKKNNASIIKPLRIGSFEIFSTHFLGSLINSLSHINELMLQEIIPSEIEKSLLDYRIDYGITNLPIPMAGIIHHRITSYELKIYGRVDIFGEVAFSDLPFVAPIISIIDSPNSIKTLDGWPDEQIERSVKYKVDMLESALELCRQGKAVAYLPTFIVKLHNNTVKSSYNLQVISSPNGNLSKKLGIYLAKRKGDPNDRLSTEIMDAITQLA